MPYSTQASNQVFEYITQKIKTRQWAPGTKIATEPQLCQEIGVSRSAVRQAIEKLSALRVLRKLQGSGTYVEEFEQTSLSGLLYYPVNRRTMKTVLEFRRMFDSYNTELFIQKCTPEDIVALQANYGEMCKSSSDHERFRYLDNEFHDLIAKGTRNPIIAQISDLLTDLLREHQSALYSNVGPEHAIQYHGMILNCIENRNAELAGIYARMHIDNSLHALEEKPEEELHLI
ncbi:MAG TPA: FCD domain-containing protein [Pseudoflavonifractor sp.]|nr:FCD domain-containing protein [Pseudoflavonifractor sp.]